MKFFPVHSPHGSRCCYAEGTLFQTGSMHAMPLHPFLVLSFFFFFFMACYLWKGKNASGMLVYSDIWRKYTFLCKAQPFRKRKTPVKWFLLCVQCVEIRLVDKNLVDIKSGIVVTQLKRYLSEEGLLANKCCSVHIPGSWSQGPGLSSGVLLVIPFVSSLL